jgi:glycine/D-amino acid oxidase-like deaminating enzyme
MDSVAVVGGGSAGTAAAVGAAQAGARTALFESFACLGGAATMTSGVAAALHAAAGKPAPAGQVLQDLQNQDARLAGI